MALPKVSARKMHDSRTEQPNRPFAARCLGIAAALILGLPMILQLCGLVRGPSFTEVGQILWTSRGSWGDLMPRLDAYLADSLGVKRLAMSVLGSVGSPSQATYRQADSVAEFRDQPDETVRSGPTDQGPGMADRQGSGHPLHSPPTGG